MNKTSLTKHKPDYNYWGFGLNISSEIEFPELLPSEFDKADVTIVLGKMPFHNESTLNHRKHIFHLLNETELTFEVKNVARYYATNGNSIIIEPDINSTEMRSVRLFVLATVMAAILLQRDLLPFHASAIIRDDRLLLITGDSGAGKSTLTAGLIKKGYTIFSDDVVVLQKNGSGDILATASYPMIKLWNDTLNNLQHEMFNDRSFLVRPGMDKYGIFFHNSFNKKSYPIDKIIVLKKGEGTELKIRELSGGEAFVAVNEQVYRAKLLKGDNLKHIRFGVITGLLKTSKVYEITRPTGETREQLLLHLEGLL